MLPQVKEFKHLKVLFKVRIDRSVQSQHDKGAEPECKALDSSVNLCPDQKRSPIQMTKMSVLSRVAGLSLRELRVESEVAHLFLNLSFVIHLFIY